MSPAIRAVLVVAVAAVAFGLAVALFVYVVRVLLRRRPAAGYWRRVARLHLWLLPAYALFLPPIVLASLVRWQMGTRPDEAGYAGPRVDGEGTWSFQSRESLRAERRASGDEGTAPATAAESVRMTTADGLSVRGFLVETTRSPPRFQAVLVHGLFRNALELEQPAAWLHGLGGDVLLLEMRNHGGSDRGCPGFGLRERRDVLAAVEFLRERPARGEAPLLLYGISLGSAAVLLAAPEVEDLGGLVVDAAVPDLEEVFHNLASSPRLGLPFVHRWLTLRAIGLLAWLDVDDVAPAEAARRLAPDLPALVVAAGHDRRTPPEAVRRVYDALRAPEGTKEFWLDADASHGKVFEEDPAAYRAALERLVLRMLERAGARSTGR